MGASRGARTAVVGGQTKTIGTLVLDEEVRIVPDVAVLGTPQTCCGAVTISVVTSARQYSVYLQATAQPPVCERRHHTLRGRGGGSSQGPGTDPLPP